MFLAHALLRCKRVISRTRSRTWGCGVFFRLERVIARPGCSWFWPWFRCWLRRRWFGATLLSRTWFWRRLRSPRLWRRFSGRLGSFSLRSGSCRFRCRSFWRRLWCRRLRFFRRSLRLLRFGGSWFLRVRFWRSFLSSWLCFFCRCGVGEFLFKTLHYRWFNC